MFKIGDKIIADAIFVADECFCASKSSEFSSKNKVFCFSNDELLSEFSR